MTSGWIFDPAREIWWAKTGPNTWTEVKGTFGNPPAWAPQARRKDTAMGTKAAVIQYADTIIRLVDEDIAAGQVPATVASFTELHDYVDANEYFEDAGVPYVTGSREETDLIAEVGDEVASRLAARTAKTAR